MGIRMLVCGWAGILALSAQAQVGVRFALFQLDRISSMEEFMKWQIGFGLDFDTSPRTAITVMGLYGPELPDLGGAKPITTSTWLGSIGFYDRTSSCYGLQLRSMYFMRDNDRAAPYVAMNAGFKVYNGSLTYDYQQPSDYSIFEQAPFPRSIKGSHTLFPVGLSIGVRNGLDGGYSDVHFFLGYQIGGGRAMVDAPFDMYTEGLVAQDKPLRTTAVSFGFGWAFGFGVAGKKSPE